MDVRPEFQGLSVLEINKRLKRLEFSKHSPPFGELTPDQQAEWDELLDELSRAQEKEKEA